MTHPRRWSLGIALGLAVLMGASPLDAAGPAIVPGADAPAATDTASTGLLGSLTGASTALSAIGTSVLGGLGQTLDGGHRCGQQSLQRERVAAAIGQRQRDGPAAGLGLPREAVHR